MAKRLGSHVRVLAFSGLVGGVFGAALVIACDTDNGETVHGPDLGPLPTLDGGRKRLPDGAIVEADGAPVVGDDDDDTSNEGGPSGNCAAGGTAAIVAGSDAALTAAVRTKGGPWKSATIGSGSAKSKPALVSFGAGFLGVSRSGGDDLLGFTYASQWSAAAKIGAAGVKGPPSLAVTATKAHVVYSGGPGANTDYMHGINDGTSWDAANALVGTASEHSFGGVSAGLAAIGDNVYFAQNGSDHGLYARPYTSGAWQAAIPVSGAGTIGTADGVTTTPEVVAVKGKYDLVIIYRYKKDTPDALNAIAYATHEPGGTPEWGNPDTKFIHGVLTAEKFAAAAVDDTTVALTFRGDDGNAYYTLGTVGTDAANPVSWTAPAPVGGTATAVDTAPSVARGDCGNAAIFAFASGGAVKTTSLKGTTFTPIEAVAGVSGSNVAIATR